MAKKSRQDELFERLHASGLRKSVAEQVSRAVGTTKKNGKTPKVVQDVVANLKSAASELEGRATGGGSDAKRKAAGKKAAATRKRNAAKRSASAKKGAQTRSRGTSKSKSASKSGTRSRAKSKS
jgi:hypothetical protein